MLVESRNSKIELPKQDDDCAAIVEIRYEGSEILVLTAFVVGTGTGSELSGCELSCTANCAEVYLSLRWLVEKRIRATTHRRGRAGVCGKYGVDWVDLNGTELGIPMNSTDRARVGRTWKLKTLTLYIANCCCFATSCCAIADRVLARLLIAMAFCSYADLR